MIREKDLIKQVSQRLDIYQISGMVEWWTRIFTGRIETKYGSWVSGAPKGTPDIVAIVRSHDKSIILLFLELKSDKGKLTKEQTDFSHKHSKPDIIFFTVRDIFELDRWMNKYSIDKTKELPNEL